MNNQIKNKEYIITLVELNTELKKIKQLLDDFSNEKRANEKMKYKKKIQFALFSFEDSCKKSKFQAIRGLKGIKNEIKDVMNHLHITASQDEVPIVPVTGPVEGGNEDDVPVTDPVPSENEDEGSVQDNTQFNEPVDMNAFINAIKNGDIDLVEYLLDKGADVNYVEVDKDGTTPLMYAISKGHVDIVKLLLDKKADVNAGDNDKLTPLMTASLYGRIEIIKILLKYGADAKKTNKDGLTALNLVLTTNGTEEEEIVEILKKAMGEDAPPTPPPTSPPPTPPAQPTADNASSPQEIDGGEHTWVEAINKKNNSSSAVIALCKAGYVFDKSQKMALPEKEGFKKIEIVGDGNCGWYTILEYLHMYGDSTKLELSPGLKDIYQNKTILASKRNVTSTGEIKYDKSIISDLRNYVHKLSGQTDNQLRDADLNYLKDEINTTLCLYESQTGRPAWRYYSKDDKTKGISIPPNSDSDLPIPLMFYHTGTSTSTDQSVTTGGHFSLLTLDDLETSKVFKIFDDDKNFDIYVNKEESVHSENADEFDCEYFKNMKKSAMKVGNPKYNMFFTGKCGKPGTFINYFETLNIGPEKYSHLNKKEETLNLYDQKTLDLIIEVKGEVKELKNIINAKMDIKKISNLSEKDVNEMLEKYDLSVNGANTERKQFLIDIVRQYSQSTITSCQQEAVDALDSPANLERYLEIYNKCKK
uniref:Ankyrin repeat protein n=1 Tax=Florenciella sp. virus SA2 TaxID=3240092 RepID=A0AB39JC38_9VIRU